MSWEQKTDYCGLGSQDGISVKSANENATNQFLEKLGHLGTIAHQRAFGHVKAPSNDYLIEKPTKLKVSLGKVTTVEGKRYALASVSATVGAGTEPTLSASSVQIEDATDGVDQEFEEIEFDLSPEEIVQEVMSAYTLSGDGCEVTQANFEASCTVNPHTKNGDPKASGIHTGKVTVQLTIGQYDENKPEVSASDGWIVSSGLTCDDPDSDTPNWTCTLQKPLEKKGQ